MPPAPPPPLRKENTGYADLMPMVGLLTTTIPRLPNIGRQTNKHFHSIDNSSFDLSSFFSYLHTPFCSSDMLFPCLFQS